MQYLIGALATVAFFVCLFGAYEAGQRSKAKAQPIQSKEIDETAQRQARQLRESFGQLMSYNEAKARERKVT